MLDTGSSLGPTANASNVAGGSRERRRPALTAGERRRADIDTAKRLMLLKREPLRPDARLFEDIEVEVGRTFTPANFKDRWAFAAVGGRRAARIAAEFDLFKEGRDLSNIRHFTLRPRPKKPAPGEARVTKARIGELDAELRRFADDYNKWTTKLVSEGLLEPIIAVVHIRFDRSIQRWDIHAHCVWMVKSESMPIILRRIGTKFSKPWYEKNLIRNPAALVNYITQWVIDHRELRRWPDEALLELWDLNRPRLIRPAGKFADFRRGLDGRTLIREADRITIREKEPPRRRYTSPYDGTRREGVVGYIRARFDGRRRLCAVWIIHAYRSESVFSVSGNKVGASPSHKGHTCYAGSATLAPAAHPTCPRECSTTSTRLTPPCLGEPETNLVPHELGRATYEVGRASVRIPRRKMWWWEVWAYGRPQPARPIVKRVERLHRAIRAGRRPDPGRS